MKERKEDYPTSAKIHTRCRVVFLRSFISALFLYFFSAPSLLEIKFYRNFFPSFCSFFGFLKQLLIRRRTRYRAGDEPVSRWRRTRWKRAFELKPHTHTQLATSDFHTDLRPRWLLLSHTCSPPKTGGITLSYSPPSIRYIHKSYIRNSTLR